MNELDRLQDLLSRFPGIGPRQARRFAYFLMQVPQDYIDQLVDSLSVLRSNKYHCTHCNRIYFKTNKHNQSDKCPTCADPERESGKLLIVAKQADFENIEQAHVWRGQYFILGRTVRLSDKNPENSLPMGLLLQRLQEFDLEEIVFGLPINPEGEYTVDTIEDTIADVVKTAKIKVSHLGRGLSVGSELEYSDPQTISAALENRS